MACLFGSNRGLLFFRSNGTNLERNQLVLVIRLQTSLIPHSEKCTGPPTPCGEERCSCPHPSSRHCKDWEQFPTIKGMKKHYSKNVLSKNSAVMQNPRKPSSSSRGIHLSVGLKPTAHSALPFDTPAGTSRSFPTPPQSMSEGTNFWNSFIDRIY